MMLFFQLLFHYTMFVTISCSYHAHLLMMSLDQMISHKYHVVLWPPHVALLMRQQKIEEGHASFNLRTRSLAKLAQQ
jgi:hypothetical protein